MAGNALHSRDPGLDLETLEPHVPLEAAAESAPAAGISVTCDETLVVGEEIIYNLSIVNSGGRAGQTPYVDFAVTPDVTIDEISTAESDLNQRNGDPVTQPIGEIAADGRLVGIASGAPVAGDIRSILVPPDL